MATYSRSAFAIVPAMTAADAPSPLVASASTFYNADWAAWRAFGGDAGGNGWSTAPGDTTATCWLKIDLGSGQARSLDSYTLTARSDGYPQGTPTGWTIYGSNDNSAWTAVHVVSGEAGFGNGEMRAFALPAPSEAYRYYRFSVATANGVTDGASIKRWEPSYRGVRPTLHTLPMRGRPRMR